MTSESSGKDETSAKISILSILHLCWALTMNFSSNENQQKLAANHMEFFAKIPSANESCLRGAVGKTLRNIGYTRNGYEKYMNTLKDSYEKKITVFDSMGSILSTSKESLSSKIAVFLISGFGFDAIFSRSLQKIISSGEVLTIFKKLPNHEYIFIITIGLFSITLFTLGFSLYRPIYERQKKLQQFRIEEDFYQKKFQPDMTEYMYQLYIDLKNCKSVNLDDDVATQSSGNTPEAIKKFIRDNIIPKYAIDMKDMKMLFSPVYKSNLEI